MKKFGLILIACLLLFPIGVLANEITIEWDINPEPDVENYKLWQGVATGNYGVTPIAIVPQPVSGTKVEFKVENLADGTYLWAISAVDMTGNEGVKSAEVTHIFFAGDPTAPGGIRKKIVIEIPIP